EPCAGGGSWCAVIDGWAGPGLVDSYHSERHPVGKRLLMNTRAQGLLLLSGPEMQPLREVLAELVGFEEVNRHLAGMVSGIEITYDVGTGTHPLLGRRMPHLELVGEHHKSSSTELLHSGRGVLLDLADNARLRERAAPWSACSSSAACPVRPRPSTRNGKATSVRTVLIATRPPPRPK
ncbi:monooxygenase, partial [Streptomyces sp. NPDC005180]